MAKDVSGTRREHAVVIGASIGGLAAAAALAPHYRRVTVLERDTLPDRPAHRKAVPQGKHAHGLQPGGLHAFEKLLPGLVDELRAAGAPIGDTSADCRWTVGGNRFARATATGDGIGITRPLLEHSIRARVAALPNVTIRDDVEVRALLAADRRVVTGVEIAAVGDHEHERVAADLVVDASGKVSQLPRWLTSLGYDVPDEEQVHCKMAYLTRRWRLAPAHATPDVVTVCTPAAQPHFGVMIAQEDGTHIVTLGGLLGQRPASTEADYRQFAQGLPDSAIADALVDATPVTELQPSHFPASRRRRYDRMRSFPDGLLALGDALAAFNPMYGQGMTVAALEAVALRDMLARGPVRPLKFLAHAHRIADVAWKISTGGDLRYEQVQGRRTPDMKIMNRYLDRLTANAQADPVLARKFLRVAGFVERPESMFAPSIAWRVLRPNKARANAGETVLAAPAPVANLAG
jgi:2-polyprenyl-6-methoxyphenol hydroxylase-like FAD-dependent oxidoreductase